MPVAKVCEKCQKVFSVPPRRAEKVRFCSWACKTDGSRVALSCKQCGKGFTEYKSQVAAGMGVYCSKPCMSVAKSDPTKPASKYRVKVQREVCFQTCEVCENKFKIPPVRAASARFCSRACKSISPELKQEISVLTRGDKNPRWKGGRYASGSTGYVTFKKPEHPYAANASKRVFEHRLVIETWLRESDPQHPFLIDIEGVKYLRREIDVHHINCVRDDNRRTNLMAVTKDAHHRIHNHAKCPDPWECWPVGAIPSQ